MSKTFNPARRVVLPRVRVAYPALVAPRPGMNGDNNDLKYRLTLLIDRNDQASLTAISNAVNAASLDFWGGAAQSMIQREGFKNPCRDGRKFRNPDHPLVDYYTINSKSNDRPVIWGADGAQADPSIIYGGCYCAVSLCFSAFSRTGANGVSCYIDGIKFIEDGEPIQTGDKSDRIRSQFETAGIAVGGGAPQQFAQPQYQAPQAQQFVQPAQPQYQAPQQFVQPQPQYAPQAQQFVQPAQPQYQAPQQYAQPQYQQAPQGSPMAPGYVNQMNDLPFEIDVQDNFDVAP